MLSPISGHETIRHFTPRKKSKTV